jgi:Ice-binding-like
MLKRNQILANSKLKKERTVKKSEMKCGSVNLMKRVSASLLGAAVALCLTAANLAAAAPPATVDLGQAGHFAVLAHETVTNTGNTKINGDLGVAPGTAVVGFFPVDGGPGVVNGTIYTPTTICPNNKACLTQTNTVAASGQASLLVAYNDAAGRTVAPVDITGIDLGGKTLAPGLYKSTSGIAITGDLTLAGNGIYIFQSASTLKVNSASRVVLSGGAKAADVFWQVGSSATLGTTSAFKGTILALTSISLATGATLDGSALAQRGSVTLDTNAVAKQATNTVTTIPRHDD